MKTSYTPSWTISFSTLEASSCLLLIEGSGDLAGEEESRLMADRNEEGTTNNPVVGPEEMLTFRETLKGYQQRKMFLHVLPIQTCRTNFFFE